MKITTIVLAASLFLPLTGSVLPVFADDEGHHHEELTEQQLGTVHFPVSCTDAVQKPFQRGVALLHSFWYEEAEKEFVDIAKDDPKCAMAQWGLAMSQWHQLWNHPDDAVTKKGKAEVKKAKSLHAKTPRERGYIAAIYAFYAGKGDFQARATAYTKGMEKVYEQNPDDHEAAAFYALSLLTSNEGNDPNFTTDKKAAAILEKLFAIEPDHPGVAHYMIHAYDKPQLAQLGLPAARRYAQIAPASPHALHMPSHIFARVGMWQEDINSNLASVAATRKSAAMHMGGEGHQFHAMDFLFYAYLQSGRDADARALVEEVKAMPASHDMYGLGFDPHAAAIVHFTALYPLEMRHWADAAALTPAAIAGKEEDCDIYWARAIGAAHLGNAAQVKDDAAHLDEIHKQLVAEKKKEFAEGVDDQHKEALAWLSVAEGKYDDALAVLRPMADKEDSLGEEPQGIPTREMLAEILLMAKRPEQALAEYETDLKFNPNRFNGLYGAAQAAEAAGKQEKAAQYYEELVKVCAGSNSDRPELSKAKGLVAEK
jgi:tetratricopeptide (TPR) repeat protein